MSQQTDGINQVHGQLYIADIAAARTSDMSTFDAIVTVCQDSIEDHIPDGTDYHFFNMADGPECDYGGKSDYQFFKDAAQTILDHLESGETILVHCHMGQSRSASTSLAALSVLEDVTYHEMFLRVKESRPQINPDGLLRDHAIRFIEEQTDIDHTPFQ